jgi:regulator of RNase E activity RraA
MATCRISAEQPLPAADLIDRFGKLATSLVSDVFDRWSGAGDVLPVSGLEPGQVVVGPALTVRTRPGDNLAVHKALDLGRPGEVLVVAAGGAVDRAILGGLMGHYATRQGFAAVVVDGAVRDLSDLEAKAPPTFARGVSHLGPYKDGPGDIRCPVAINGLAVQDGDLIVADEDGITCVPRARMHEILELAEAKAADEAGQDVAIAEGRWDRSWVDASLDIVHVD